MDHHCPWTSNCVSHFTFPHFIRFLFYATIGMSYLETLLWSRASIVWSNRNLPSVSSLPVFHSRLLTFPVYGPLNRATGTSIRFARRQQLDCFRAFFPPCAKLVLACFQHDHHRILGDRATRNTRPTSPCSWRSSRRTGWNQSPNQEA